MTIRVDEPRTWTPAETRAWVERHGGNVTALARRLRVNRTRLQSWLADPGQSSSARALPPAVQTAMELMDRIQHLESQADASR